MAETLPGLVFEQTSFDGNFATGEPDPNAIAGYEKTLDELKAMAEKRVPPS